MRSFKKDAEISNYKDLTIVIVQLILSDSLSVTLLQCHVLAQQN